MYTVVVCQSENTRIFVSFVTAISAYNFFFLFPYSPRSERKSKLQTALTIIVLSVVISLLVYARTPFVANVIVSCKGSIKEFTIQLEAVRTNAEAQSNIRRLYVHVRVFGLR